MSRGIASCSLPECCAAVFFTASSVVNKECHQARGRVNQFRVAFQTQLICPALQEKTSDALTEACGLALRLCRPPRRVHALQLRSLDCQRGAGEVNDAHSVIGLPQQHSRPGEMTLPTRPRRCSIAPLMAAKGHQRSPSPPFTAPSGTPGYHVEPTRPTDLAWRGDAPAGAWRLAPAHAQAPRRAGARGLAHRP